MRRRSTPPSWAPAEDGRGLWSTDVAVIGFNEFVVRDPATLGVSREWAFVFDTKGCCVESIDRSGPVESGAGAS